MPSHPKQKTKQKTRLLIQHPNVLIFVDWVQVQTNYEVSDNWHLLVLWKDGNIFNI